MVAVLNNGGGFYDAELYIHEARMCGAMIHPPCINRSDHPNVIYGKDIYLGFGYLKSLENLVVGRILTERQLHGKFRSFDDFIDRIVISREQLTILIRIDAFRFTGIPKKELLWLAVFSSKVHHRDPVQPLLFQPKHRDFVLPHLPSHKIEDAYDQIELLGFPLCSYFELMDRDLEHRFLAKDLPDNLGKEILIYGTMVHTRHNITSKGDLMRFTTFLDAKGEFFDCVHFPQAVARSPIHGKGAYACYGKVTEEFGFYSLQIQWTKKQHIVLDKRQDIS